MDKDILRVNIIGETVGEFSRVVIAKEAFDQIRGQSKSNLVAQREFVGRRNAAGSFVSEYDFKGIKLWVRRESTPQGRKTICVMTKGDAARLLVTEGLAFSF